MCNNMWPCTDSERIDDDRKDAFFQFTKAFKFSMYSDLLLLLLPFFFFFFFCISKFPFYIQRHYRKAFNSSHNVLCIWILKEEMETFFAAAFKLFFFSAATERKKKEKFYSVSFFFWGGLEKYLTLFWQNPFNRFP